MLCLAGCTVCQTGATAWHHHSTPTPGDRFPLPPDGSDVVGDVQSTTSRYQDTLLDIARRYDLGYDEIVAANPGVDPWLPGEGTGVVLPTQFVLPAGGREGVVLNLASKRLFYFPQAAPGAAAEVITHPVGIGREGWLTRRVRSSLPRKSKNRRGPYPNRCARSTRKWATPCRKSSRRVRITRLAISPCASACRLI